MVPIIFNRLVWPVLYSHFDLLPFRGDEEGCSILVFMWIGFEDAKQSICKAVACSFNPSWSPLSPESGNLCNNLISNKVWLKVTFPFRFWIRFFFANCFQPQEFLSVFSPRIHGLGGNSLFTFAGLSLSSLIFIWNISSFTCKEVP